MFAREAEFWRRSRVYERPSREENGEEPLVFPNFTGYHFCCFDTRTLLVNMQRILGWSVVGVAALMITGSVLAGNTECLIHNVSMHFHFIFFNVLQNGRKIKRWTNHSKGF